MKQLRHRAIRDVVVARPIRTQQELAAALRERGFRTTQATMSRDVAELGLVKAPRDGTQAYALPSAPETAPASESPCSVLLVRPPQAVHHVRDVMVAGEMVVADRLLTRLDQDEVAARAREQAERLWRRVDELPAHPFGPGGGS